MIPRSRSPSGIALISVVILLLFLTFLLLVFVTLVRIERGVSEGASLRARARLLTASGVEYAYARLWQESLPVPLDGRTVGNAPDDWAYREADTAVSLGTAVNPSYNANLEGHFDDNGNGRFDYDDTNGNGRYDTADTGEGATDPGLNGNALYDPYSGRLRGAFGSHGDTFRLKVLDANSLIHVNDGDGTGIFPNRAIQAMLRKLAVETGLARTDLDLLLTTRPLGGYTSWDEVYARCGSTAAEREDRFARIRDYVTLHAWEDPRVPSDGYVQFTATAMSVSWNAPFEPRPRSPLYLGGAPERLLKIAGLVVAGKVAVLDDSDTSPFRDPLGDGSRRIPIIDAEADAVAARLASRRSSIRTWRDLFVELAADKGNLFPQYAAHPGGAAWQEAYENIKVDMLHAAFAPDVLVLPAARRSYLSWDLDRETAVGAWGTDRTAPREVQWQTLVNGSKGNDAFPVDLSLIPSGYFDIESIGSVRDATAAEVASARARAHYRASGRIPARTQEDFENLRTEAPPVGEGVVRFLFGSTLRVLGAPVVRTGVETFPKFDQRSFDRDAFAVGGSEYGFNRNAGDIRLAKRRQDAAGADLYLPFEDDAGLAALGAPSDPADYEDNLRDVAGGMYVPESYEETTGTGMTVLTDTYNPWIKLIGDLTSTEKLSNRNRMEVVDAVLTGSYAGESGFTLRHPLVPDSQVVRETDTAGNTTILAEGTDYALDDETGEMTFLVAPATGSSIAASYEHYGVAQAVQNETYAFPGGMTSQFYGWGTGMVNTGDLPVLDIGIWPEGTITFLVPVQGNGRQGGGFDLFLSDGDRLYVLYRERDLWLLYASSAGGFWQEVVPLAPPPADRAWRQLAVTFNDTEAVPTIRIRLDGTVVASHAGYAPLAAGDPHSIKFLRFWGDLLYGSGSSDGGVSYVDDVRLYDTDRGLAGTLLDRAADRYETSGEFVSPLYRFGGGVRRSVVGEVLTTSHSGGGYWLQAPVVPESVTVIVDNEDAFPGWLLTIGPEQFRVDEETGEIFGFSGVAPIGCTLIASYQHYDSGTRFDDPREILGASWSGFEPISGGDVSASLLLYLTADGSDVPVEVPLDATGAFLPLSDREALSWRYRVVFSDGTGTDTPVFDSIDVLYRLAEPEILRFEFLGSIWR